jgi:hypothetical protein
MEYIVVIVLFIAIIVTVTTWASSSSYVPYSTSMLFSKQFPYEGFRPITEYTTYPENKSADSYVQKDIIEPPMGNEIKIRPFGLVSSANAVEMPLNIFGNDKGSPQCEQSIYTNSGGFLCLDEAQKKLLKTRGGNATGCSKQQVV